MERKKKLVLWTGFLKKTQLYFELMIYDKYRGKNTGPQCVNMPVCYFINFFLAFANGCIQ
jgi:hypothetical protein